MERVVSVVVRSIHLLMTVFVFERVTGRTRDGLVLSGFLRPKQNVRDSLENPQGFFLPRANHDLLSHTRRRNGTVFPVHCAVNEVDKRVGGDSVTNVSRGCCCR